MIKMVKVVDAKPLGNWRLHIRFSDGSEGAHDFSEFVRQDGEMLKPLKDAAFFDRVHIEYGVPTWPNGFDLDAIALHMQMEEAGELRIKVAAE
jgi:Protein of unknown function (DUF2442)